MSRAKTLQISTFPQSLRRPKSRPWQAKTPARYRGVAKSSSIGPKYYCVDNCPKTVDNRAQLGRTLLLVGSREFSHPPLVGGCETSIPRLERSVWDGDKFSACSRVIPRINGDNVSKQNHQTYRSGKVKSLPLGVNGCILQVIHISTGSTTTTININLSPKNQTLRVNGCNLRPPNS